MFQAIALFFALSAAPVSSTQGNGVLAPCDTFGPRLDGTVVTVCDGSVTKVCDAAGNCNVRPFASR